MTMTRRERILASIAAFYLLLSILAGTVFNGIVFALLVGINPYYGWAVGMGLGVIAIAVLTKVADNVGDRNGYNINQARPDSKDRPNGSPPVTGTEE